MGTGFQFEQHRLGLWDMSWDLKKTICWEMVLGPPLHDPQTCPTSQTFDLISDKIYGKPNCLHCEVLLQKCMVTGL